MTRGAGNGTGSVTIGPIVTADHAAVKALYPRAFPNEDLAPLVAAILDHAEDARSLGARCDGRLVGHVALTRGAGRVGWQAALLGPLAVAPGHQRTGIGSALVRAGLDHLAAQGGRCVFVLGDPGYYGRFGFARENSVRTPYALPPAWADAWQSLCLPGRAPLAPGRLHLPDFWMQRDYWSD